MNIPKYEEMTEEQRDDCRILIKDFMREQYSVEHKIREDIDHYHGINHLAIVDLIERVDYLEMHVGNLESTIHDLQDEIASLREQI